MIVTVVLLSLAAVFLGAVIREIAYGLLEELDDLEPPDWVNDGWAEGPRRIH